MPSAEQEYARRLRERRAAHDAAAGAERRISNLRLVVFVTGLVGAFVVWRVDLSAAWLLVPAVGFVGLVIAHDRASRRAARARRAQDLYEAGLRRLDGSWPGHGVVRDDFAPADHPYATDLDLFGRGSMFDRMCTARTGAGIGRLAAWLLAAASPDEVRRRQRAVEELRPRVDLREAIALAGDELTEQVDPEVLVEWGEAPAKLDDAAATRWRAVAWIVALTNLSLAGTWAAGVTGPWPLLTSAIVTWVIDRYARRFTDAVAVGVERPSHELAVVASLLRRFESETFEDPYLSRLRAALVTGPVAASTRIGRLVRLAQWLEAKRSQLFGPIAFGLMWGVHFSIAIEAWRRAHGGSIREWFAALGELEALASIAAYAYERPNDPFPELDDGPPHIEGVAIGHPLLDPARCVRNPISLSPARRACVVSGSNMSGKSTYLRTVGLNVVLAQAGAPVCAQQLTLSALRVGATIRVQDSLAEGASRFYAEITRLRRVMDLADAGPGALFLLDEILHGTNSHDRRIGAIAVVRKLLERDAIGLVTTHDLALADAADALPGDVANVHFADQFDEGGLGFDYTLRDGVVKTSNALALMRSVGLDV